MVADRRPGIGRRVGAVGAALAAFGLVPALLMAATKQRLGGLSPLHGADPPWRWTRRGLSDWWATLTDGLATSDQLVDLFVRLAVIVGWVCVAALAVVVVGEVRYMARFGMASARHRKLAGVGRLGRWIAAGLVSVLPVSGVSIATAGAGSRPAPVAAAVQPRFGPVVQRTVDPPAGQQAGSPATHTVRRGESVWSIAEQYGAPGQVDEIAEAITVLNLGQQMNDGNRFVTAALIEPGWELRLPPGVHQLRPAQETPTQAPTPAPIPAPTPAPDAQPQPVAASAAGRYVVEPGDSYWAIAEEHLDTVNGHEVSERAIFDYVPTLMSLNAPRLGYDDPAMLHPGDTVVFEPPTPVPVVREVTVPAKPPTPIFVPPTVAEPRRPPAPPTTPPPTVPSTTATTAPSTIVETTVSRDTVRDTVTDDTRTNDTVTDDTVAPFAGPADSTGSSGLPLGLAGGTLIATGALAMMASRRRARLRRAQVNERLRPPAPERTAVEAALAAVSDAERVARMDLALRAAAGDLADQQAQVLAVLAGETGDVVLLLDVPAAPVARYWRSDLGRHGWVLPAEVPLRVIAEDSRRSAQPCPALAHLGSSVEGDVYLDLEAAGLVSVDGDPALVRAILASVALSPLAEPVGIAGVGLDELCALGNHNVEVLSSVADAAARLAAHAAHLAPLALNATTFRLRARRVAAGSSEPLVVAVAGQALGDSLDRLVELTVPGGRGVAVVVDERIEQAPVRLARVAPGVWRLDPLGIEFTPIALNEDQVEAIGEAIAAAEPDVEIVEPLTATTPGAAAPEEPQWCMLVRLLGPVCVEDRTGHAVDFDRSKSLELVVWLSQHRQRSSRMQARTALWDADVRDATFANVVSDARRAMAKLADPPDGQEWIGRTMSEHLPLHPLVVTDADLLQAATDAAFVDDSTAAAARLDEALAMVHGMPFTGTSYLWPDGEGITSALILLVTNAAVHLANRYLAVGDVDGVFRATRQGLLALPGHEELVGLRMRAHAQRGDRAGVRQEWESYERAIRGDVWGSGEPSPKLVAIRAELLGTAGAAATRR